MNRIIIDVREPSEYASGHVAEALNVPPSQLMSGASALKDVPKDTELVLYCLSGSRSNVSMNILRTMGYTNVINGINKDQVAAKYGLGIVRG
jgi:rhodanese-related sulfurtransferase